MSLSVAIRRIYDRFMGGRGEFSITVPVMDGPFKPNDYLERAPGVAAVEAADNLVAAGGRLLLSSGRQLLELVPGGKPGLLRALEAEITCLADSPGGALAVGLTGRGVAILGGRHDGRRFGESLSCPTAALFLDEDTLVVAQGSADCAAADWSRDLLQHGRSGTVTRFDLVTGEARVLAAGLAFPSGLCRGGAGEILVSEAWRHRIVALGEGAPKEVLSGLPAYPGRLCPAETGGYWLACFAVRSQLQEFILREKRYLRQMMAEVEPRFWIAPALSSGQSFKEPLQAGGVIRLGIHKPWAPTRSYGLVLRLDPQLRPAWSAHSRANGRRHGVTAVAESGGRLFAAAKGKGELLALTHTALSEPADLAGGQEVAA